MKPDMVTFNGKLTAYGCYDATMPRCYDAISMTPIALRLRVYFPAYLTHRILLRYFLIGCSGTYRSY